MKSINYIQAILSRAALQGFSKILALLLSTVLVVACAEGTGDGSGGDGETSSALRFSCGTSIEDMDFNYRGATSFYLAPGTQGTDVNNDCRSRGNPCKTFARAAGEMGSGDGLILLDGTYTIAANGSLERFNRQGNLVSPFSADLPSGPSVQRPTVVAAENPGMVVLEGGLRIGNPSQKFNNIHINGITFHERGSINNGNFIAIKNSGFEGGLGIGTIDHSQGNSCNLLEDVWAWGKNMRTAVTVYRANNNLLRRVLIRHDGCDQDWCGEKSGNGSAGITVYNSNNNILENVLVLDRSYGANLAGRYADFSTAQHDSNQPPQPGGELLSNNQWLGNMSINSEESGMIFEADAVGVGTTATVRDFVVLNSAGGVSLDPAHRSFNGISRFDVNKMHVYPSSGGFIVGCDVVNVSDPATSQSPHCGNVHIISNVNNGPYVPGLAATTVPQKRYGTVVDLWPWPNQTRIKNDICEVNGTPINRGLCGTGQTISQYINSF